MNLKDYLGIFESKAWVIDVSRSDFNRRLHFTKRLEEFNLWCGFDLLKTMDGAQIGLLVGKSCVRLDKVAAALWVPGERAGVPVAIKTFLRKSGNPAREVSLSIGSLLDEIEIWAQSETVDQIIDRAISDRPDTDGTRQALHVVALSAKGYWQTLGDYKDDFSSGKTRNFVTDGFEAMTIDILGRAYSHAIDVAFPA